MNRRDINKLIDQNPFVDKILLKESIEVIKQLRDSRVSRSNHNIDIPYSKKARLIDDRDELRHGQVSYQQY